MSLCFKRVFPFGAVLGSVSDLLGLRLSLPLQSRPAQISDGTQDSTKARNPFAENIATVSCKSATLNENGG